MYLSFNKGLVFENKKIKIKKIFKSNEGILFKNHIFRNLWHCSRWSAVTPTRGHFLISFCQWGLFFKGSGEVWVRRVITRGREGGWRAVYNWGVCLPPLSRSCYVPGKCSGHVDWLLFRCLIRTVTGLWRNSLQEFSPGPRPQGFTYIPRWTCQWVYHWIETLVSLRHLQLPVSSLIYLTHIYQASAPCQYQVQINLFARNIRSP